MSFVQLEDLHCHSFLSACCHDERMTPQTLLKHAEQCGYRALCLTDHLWDSAIPGSSSWYAPQDIEHVLSSRPLPEGEVPFFFGCETELPMNGIPALARDHFDLFDFVVIPPNHFHMEDFVRPAHINTPELVARYLEDRLENLLMQDLPFRKIGIAHLTTPLSNGVMPGADIMRAADEKRLLRIFEGFSRAGAGIELNAQAFENWDARREDLLKPYRIAKEAGCKFYLSSDAHSAQELDGVASVSAQVADALGLTEDDRYSIPAK